MFSSTNEDIGFSAIKQEELEKVNGGIDPVSVGLVTIAVGLAIGSFINVVSKK
jgi:lactobin A/cerein 7B family class IIb bacteriocin